MVMKQQAPTNGKHVNNPAGFDNLPLLANALVFGTATGGGSSYLEDTSRVFGSEMVGHYLVLLDGKGAGEASVILAVLPDRGRLYVQRVWQDQPRSGTIYAVLETSYARQFYEIGNSLNIAVAVSATINGPTFFNADATGVLAHVRIDAYSPPGTWRPRAQTRDNDLNFVTIWTAQDALTQVGDYYYNLAPLVGLDGMTEQRALRLPQGNWRLQLVYGGEGGSVSAWLDAQYVK